MEEIKDNFIVSRINSTRSTKKKNYGIHKLGISKKGTILKKQNKRHAESLFATPYDSQKLLQN